MSSIFKNPVTYLIIVILGLVLYIFLRPTSSSNDAKITADERKYDSLQSVDTHKLDSVTSFYDKKMDTINTKIAAANNQIAQNNQLLKSLQDAYNKEVPVIDSYDVDALRLYFSNYRQQSPDTTNNK
jgi:hypothetical protein